MSRPPYNDRRDKNYLLTVGAVALLALVMWLWLRDVGVVSLVYGECR